MVKKLGHKIAIVRAVKELKNSAVNVMERYHKTCARDPSFYGKQVSSQSSCEWSTNSEPVRQFERGKLGALKKRYTRPRRANGLKTQRGLKLKKKKASDEGRHSESDLSYISQKSLPVTHSTQTCGILSEDKLCTFTKLKEGKDLDLPVSSIFLPEYSPMSMRPPVKKKIPSPETEFEDMSVDQVCNWIGEFGTSQGWCNSDTYTYVESFRLKKIDGRQLVCLTPEDFLEMNMVKKLGHKIAIVRAVKELKNSAVNVMERYHKTCARDPSFYGKQVSSQSSCEWSTNSEPVRQFERGKLGALKKRYTRPREANGYKPLRGLKLIKKKANEDGRLSESDESCISQKSLPVTHSTQTRVISSKDKLYTSTKLKEGTDLDLPVCSIDPKEEQNTGVCDYDSLKKVRVSYVLDAPEEEPKEINDLTDSDEADNYRDLSEKSRKTAD